MVVLEYGNAKDGYATINVERTEGVLKPGKWGIMEKNNRKVVIEPQFAYEPIYLYGDKFLVCSCDGWKYNQVGDFYDCDNKKWGVITLEGKEFIPIQYEQIKPIRIDNKIFFVCKKGKWGIFNYKREVAMPFEFDSIGIIDNHLFRVEKNNKIELRDVNNNILVKTDRDFDYGWETSDGGILIRRYYKTTNKELLGLYDYKKNKEIVPMIYDSLWFLNEKYLFGYRKDYEISEIISIEGNVIDTGEYSFFYVGNNDSKNSYKEYKYIGMVFSMPCDELVYFNITKDNRIQSVVGNSYIDDEYKKDSLTEINDDNSVFYDNDTICIGGLEYKIFEKNIIKDCCCINIMNSRELQFEGTISKKPGIWGLKIHKQLDFENFKESDNYIEPEYKIIEPQFLYEPLYAYNNTYVVYKGEKWHKKNQVFISNYQKCGVIDSNGEIIIPFEYDEIIGVWKIGTQPWETKYIARKNGKWGVIGRIGATLIPFNYEKIEEDVKSGRYKFICSKSIKYDEEEIVVL